MLRKRLLLLLLLLLCYFCISGEGFSYLMSSCRENELRYTLVFVQSILATVRLV